MEYINLDFQPRSQRYSEVLSLSLPNIGPGRSSSEFVKSKNMYKTLEVIIINLSESVKYSKFNSYYFRTFSPSCQCFQVDLVEPFEKKMLEKQRSWEQIKTFL